MIREFINNTEAFLGLVLVLPVAVAIIVGIVAVVIISLIWGIIALIGMFVVIFGGVALFYKQPKIGLILVIIGVVMVVASTTFGLEIGTIDLSTIPGATTLNAWRK